jgi:GT2 family glycosyltransferase
MCGWAEAALAHFLDPAVAAVAPLVLRWTGAASEDLRIDSAGDCYFPGGFAAKRGRGERVGPAFLRPCAVFGASASSAFYRRAVVLQVGAFPAAFESYFEDVDLALRLRRAGYRAVYEPGSRVLHRVSASHGRVVGKLLMQQSRNEERVFWRNTAARDLPWAVPLHLAVVIGKAWRRWCAGELGPFLCGRLRVLGEVRALVQHRCDLFTRIARTRARKPALPPRSPVGRPPPR